MDDLDSFLSELGIENQVSQIRPVNSIEDLHVDEEGNVEVGPGIYTSAMEMDVEIPDRTMASGQQAMDQLESLYREAINQLGINTITTTDTSSISEEPDTSTSNLTEPTLRTINIHNDDSARFSGAEWFDKMQEMGVSIIGLGGIGSWLALLISRLKLRYMYCRDMDKVEQVNLAGQLYRVHDIGSNKTEAIRNTINMFNERRPSIYMDSQEFTVNSYLPGVSSITSIKNVLLGLDSITARQTVYNYWKANTINDAQEHIFIDGRLTADKWQIFAVTSKDRKRMEVYEREWLFPESEAQHLPCSFKQTTYLAAMIASYMCNLFVNFVAESTKPIVPYSIPFMTEFDAQTFEMKTYECN